MSADDPNASLDPRFLLRRSFMATSTLSGSLGSPCAACMVSVMNEVASSSRLSEIAMQLEARDSDVDCGEAAVERVSESGSINVEEVDVDDDRSLILPMVLVCFMANSLIRNCCSREESPTKGSEVGVGDGVSCAGFSSLGEGTLLLPSAISGVELGYRSEGGDPVGVLSRGVWRWGDTTLIGSVGGTDGDGGVGGRKGVCSGPS